MRFYLGVLAFTACAWSWAQSTDFPLGHPVYSILSQQEIRSVNGFGTTVKPFSNNEVFQFYGELASDYLSKEMRRYTMDSSISTRPIFKKLYQYPADFFYYHDKNLDLHVNPMIHFGVGRTNDAVGTTFINSRGIELKGTIDEKVAFYTSITENQRRYAAYINDVRDSTLVIPREGFWKQYSETGVDFFRAQGYIDFGLSKSISAQLGFGKHFVGNGIRSLILSDYSNNYPYLRINTQTKVFDYTNIFAELIAGVQGNQQGTFGFDGFAKKYLAFHHLNIKLKPNLHIGLFESVMYGDSTGGLKLEYMNPIIFYRAIEQQNGSEDNALLGLDFKWNIRNRISLYGQLVIDEMIVSEVFGGNGWWGNKQGFQMGGKYVDAFGLENLMLQGEINRVRPYMYAHEDGFTNYSHYNLSLAHPLGANFTEYLGRASFRLNDQWNVETTLLSAAYGNDVGDVNYGRDVLKDYTMRVPNGNGGSQDFGNEHLQGNRTALNVVHTRVSYMWKHNLFFDGEVTLRKEKDTNGLVDRMDAIVGFAIRLNVQAKNYLF